MLKQPIRILLAVIGLGTIIWLSLNAVFKKEIPVIAERTRPKSISIPQRHDLSDGAIESNEVPESARHAAGKFQKNQQLMEEKERRKLQTQLDALRKLQGDQLMLYAADLDLPDNTIRATLPKFYEAKRDLEGLKINGLGDEHPTVKSQVEKIEVMARQLDEGIAGLRSRLKDQLDLLPNRAKNDVKGATKTR